MAFNSQKLNKISPNFWIKSGQKAKIATSKLNLKAQNIYIKPLLKPQHIYNKPSVETACVCENLLDKK